MNHFLSILWAGVIGGIVMQVWVQFLYRIGFTSLNLIRYLGCVVIGKQTGPLNYLAGTLLHFIISIIDAFTYMFMLHFIWGHTGAIPGFLFGILHANGSGFAIIIFDFISPCVRAGSMPPIKLYARGYGITATIAFMSSILLYGLFTGAFLP
jgi:hypothetical protein